MEKKILYYLAYLSPRIDEEGYIVLQKTIFLPLHSEKGDDDYPLPPYDPEKEETVVVAAESLWEKIEMENLGVSNPRLVKILPIEDTKDLCLDYMTHLSIRLM